MVVLNYGNSISSLGSNPATQAKPLVKRVRHYFDQHPEVGREEFLLRAVRREIDLRERNERWTSVNAGEDSKDTSRRFTTRPPLTPEYIRDSARLAQRLAAIHYQRHGLWPKIRKFFFG